MSEPISTDNDDYDEDSEGKSDFMKVSGNIFSNIPYKLTFFMFLIGMVIFSDLFIDGFLNNISGTVDGECPTSKGTMIQLLVYSLVLILLHLLISYEWI